jgi:hypothetical protein
MLTITYYRSLASGVFISLSPRSTFDDKLLKD